MFATESKARSNVVTDSILIPESYSKVLSHLRLTAPEVLYPSVFLSTKFTQGNWTTVGSVMELTLKDKSVMTTRSVFLSDDQSSFEMEVLPLDNSAPRYLSRSRVEESSMDESTVVSFETVFLEGTTKENITLIKKMYVNCLNDLALFFGNGYSKICESAVISDMRVEELWSKYKSETAWSFVKSCIYLKGSIEVLGSEKQWETVEGDKMTLKLAEISESEYSVRFQVLSSSIKGCTSPSSMTTGLKMSPVTNDNKVLLEVCDWYSSDVKPEFVERRREMSRQMLKYFISMGKNERESSMRQGKSGMTTQSVGKSGQEYVSGVKSGSGSQTGSSGFSGQYGSGKK
jgi:hypothetical protein